jgi:SH3-like domain-containing protein
MTFVALFFNSGFCEQEEFPFAGSIMGNDVNIRAGQNINFEVIFQVNEGDKIIVFGKEGDWYKIQVPNGAFAYVHQDLLDVEMDKGKVKGGNVNLRAGAGTNYTILGQVNKPDTVEVVDKIDDWYMVKPPQSAVAWVNVDFVARYSTLEKYEKEEEIKSLAAKKFDELEQAYVKELGKSPAESGFEPLLTEYQDFFLAHPDFIDAELVDKRIKEIELKVAAAAYLKSQEALEKKLSELEKTKITALTVSFPIIGEVVDLTTPKLRLPYPVTHNLLVDKEIGDIFIKEVGYYLKSDKYVLNRYLYRKVKVWGKVLISAAWEYPIIVVEKLERVR